MSLADKTSRGVLGVILSFLLILTFHSSASAANPSIAVLLSREIGPYVSMVEGLEKRLASFSVQRFFLDKKGNPYSLDGGALEPDRYVALVAVGPRALRYLQQRNLNKPLLFGMVLNPREILGEEHGSVCGVNLNIPTAEQFAVLQQQFPWMQRLGVLFDPANNRDWFERAEGIAEPLGLQLVPLQIEGSSSRLEIVGDLTLPDVLLFIPDKTIISRVVIQHVIKQGVLRGIPAVGYNRFFLDSGAALSFIISYERSGEKVARQLLNLLNAGSCQGIVAPHFDVDTNRDTWRALRLDEREESQ